MFLKTCLLLKTMKTVIFDKNFLDHPEQQKTTKNSDISLKQHFTLMKIQLNSVCFVSIFGIAKNFVLFQTIIFRSTNN